MLVLPDFCFLFSGSSLNHVTRVEFSWNWPKPVMYLLPPLMAQIGVLSPHCTESHFDYYIIFLNKLIHLQNFFSFQIFCVKDTTST